MAEANYLSDDFLRQLTAAGEADILVAVPTSNNRHTIEQVAKAVVAGLVKYYPRERAAIVNPDASSRDGTAEALKQASQSALQENISATVLRSIPALIASYPPGQGQGGALRLVLAAADLLRAKACVILSPGVTNITPEWIDALVRPIYREKFDFLTPLYQRSASEGLLVRNVLAPLVRAAYGLRIEEPASEEAGFSGATACHLLAQDVWGSEILRHGAATWMTTTVLAGNFRVCQSYLGPKITSEKRTGSGLVGAIQHSLGALFESLEAHQEIWPHLTGSRAAPAFGVPPDAGLEPARISGRQMFEMFRKGTREISSILELILAAPTLEGVRGVAAGDDHCNFPDALWVKTVYDFAVSFHRRVISRDHLLQAFAPLYRGRVSSFLLENQQTNAEGLAQRTEALQLEFERMKPYLVEGWCGKV
ncbi:MAG: hypothetical protein KGM47_07585 [Acidobacteriota bacterium]|nr:hypothetical protein [Acidobacteriota bacterium]